MSYQGVICFSCCLVVRAVHCAVAGTDLLVTVVLSVFAVPMDWATQLVLRAEVVDCGAALGNADNGSTGDDRVESI